MTRGKYASTTEARQARETALADAERARRRIAVLEGHNAELRTEVERLRADIAASVSAELQRTRADLVATREQLAASREVIDQARRAIRDTFENTVRGLMKLGLPLNIAADRTEEATTFLVGDELLGYEDIATEWSGGKLGNIRKRARHEREIPVAVNRVDKRRNRDAYNRQQGGVFE